MDLKYKVSEDTEVVLDGHRYLLESGDEIMVYNEGIVGKVYQRVASAIANPDTKQKVINAVEKFVQNKFGTTNPDELLSMMAEKMDLDKLKQTAKRVMDVVKSSQKTATEDIVKEQAIPAEAITELMAWLATFAYGGMGAGVLLYLWLVHDMSPIRAVERVINMALDVGSKRKKKTRRRR